MTKCPKCDKSVSKDMKFCPDCGTKVLKQESNEKLKTPRWYFITSIIMVVLLILELILLGSGISYYIGITYSLMLIMFAITGIGWASFNFFLLIYFLAKKYEKTSITLPIAFIIQVLITVPVVEGISETFGFIEIGAFSLFVIGYSLYNLWKQLAVGQ